MELNTLQSAHIPTTIRKHRIPTEASCETTTQAVDAQLPSHISQQLAIARTTQAEWSGRSLRARLNILTKMRLNIANDPRALASTVHRKNHAETLAAEILPLLDACRFLEQEAPRILRETVVSKRGRPKWLWGNRIVLRPEPLGVVLIIGPANYPLMLPGIQALQAIAAGNSVLVKPAPGCSRSVQAFVGLAESAGLPEGVLQVLPEATEAATLAIRQGVDKVFLTGSAQTGKAVSRELAESTTPSVMELSGCDAVFVLEDADLNLVTDCLLFGLTLNNSQTCMAPRRVFATDQQADAILKQLTAKLLARKPDPAALELSSPPHAVDVKIRQALTEGAKLVFGTVHEPDSGKPRGVTVLDHVTAEMSIAQADIFAPVLSFLRVASEQQALEMCSKCPYALAASVFGSTSRCQQFARRIDAGCVVINDVIVPTADPRVPFGGRGMSGHGMTRGPAGLLEMTQLKSIVSTRDWFKPHLHPPTDADVDVLEQLIRLEHAESPFQSLRAVARMIQATRQQMQLRRASRGHRVPTLDRKATAGGVPR